VQHANLLRPLLKHVRDPLVQSLCLEALDVFETRVLPRLPHMRHQVVHGDLNLGNVLLQDGRVSGILDFGDMTYTALVCDIGVMIANLANAHVKGGVEEMMRMARVLLDGYTQIVALEVEELDLLGDIWLTRCATELVLSNWRVDTCLEAPERSAPDMHRFAQQLHFLLALGTDARAAGLGSGKGGSGETYELVQRRDASIGPGSEPLSYGDRPIHVTHGEGTWLFDKSGRRYLDLYNNVPCIGHSHPRVVRAMFAQASKININMRYLHAGAISLAERLIRTTQIVPRGGGGDRDLNTVCF